MAFDLKETEQRLWMVADQMRANLGLMPSQYSGPVLGLLFPRYAESGLAEAEKSLKPTPGSRRTIGPDAYHARGVIYLPAEARFPHLVKPPDGANLPKALNDAIKAIDLDNKILPARPHGNRRGDKLCPDCICP